MIQRTALFLFLLCFKSYSQEHCIEYLFIENNKVNYYSEKLILYNDAKFFRTKYNGHSGYSSYEKGSWNRAGDTLRLIRKEIKLFPESNDSEWELNSSIESHLIKKNWIKAYGKYKLKRQEKCQ